MITLRYHKAQSLKFKVQSKLWLGRKRLSGRCRLSHRLSQQCWRHSERPRAWDSVRSEKWEVPGSYAAIGDSLSSCTITTWLSSPKPVMETFFTSSSSSIESTRLSFFSSTSHHACHPVMQFCFSVLRYFQFLPDIPQSFREWDAGQRR